MSSSINLSLTDELEGYQDAIHGRMHAFKGDLRSLLKKVP
jgi:hypothetical protein